MSDQTTDIDVMSVNLLQRERIAELEAENKRLKALEEAAKEVVTWDWAELKYESYHADWFEALVDIGLLEKLLLEGKADE